MHIFALQVSKNKFRTKFAVKKRNKGKKKKGKTATDKGGGMATLKAAPAVNGGELRQRDVCRFGETSEYSRSGL